MNWRTRPSIERLADWLNNKAKPEQVTAVKSFYDKLMRFFLHKEMAYPEETQDSNLASIETKADYVQAIQSANRELRKLNSWPELIATPGVPGSKGKFNFNFAIRTAGRPAVKEVDAAKIQIVHLAELGDLWRLRICRNPKCANRRPWFYAENRKKVHCTTECRKAEYDGSPKWKAYRRDKAKETRRTEKYQSLRRSQVAGEALTQAEQDFLRNYSNGGRS